MKLIILDRDGVINQDSDDYIKSADEWIPIAGSIDAIARLSQGGYTVVVATNQSGLGRGYFTQTTLDAMHQKMHDLVTRAGGDIAGVFYCPHTPDENCDCRKPKAGLLTAIAEQFNCSLDGVPIIGDSIRDLEAGVIKNCQPILVLTGKGEKSKEKIKYSRALSRKEVLTYSALSEAADSLLLSKGS